MSVVEQSNRDPFWSSGYTWLCPVISFHFQQIDVPRGWGTGEGEGERTGLAVRCCRRVGIPHHTSVAEAARVSSAEGMWVTAWALQAFLL